MIGGLVQQQHIRLAHQGPRQGGAPAPTTGQRGHDGISLQLKNAQNGINLLLEQPASGAIDFSLHPLQCIELSRLRCPRA